MSSFHSGPQNASWHVPFKLFLLYFTPGFQHTDIEREITNGSENFNSGEQKLALQQVDFIEVELDC